MFFFLFFNHFNSLCSTVWIYTVNMWWLWWWKKGQKIRQSLMPRFTWSKNFNIFPFRPRFECFFFDTDRIAGYRSSDLVFHFFSVQSKKKFVYKLLNYWINEFCWCVCVYVIDLPFLIEDKKKKKKSTKRPESLPEIKTKTYLYSKWLLECSLSDPDLEIVKFSISFLLLLGYIICKIKSKIKKKTLRKTNFKKKENIVYKHSTNSCFISFQIIIDLINCEQFFMTLNWLLLLLLHFYSSSWWWCFRFLYILFGHFDWAEFGTRKKFFLLQTPIIFKDLKFFFSGFFSFLKIDF